MKKKRVVLLITALAILLQMCTPVFAASVEYPDDESYKYLEKIGDSVFYYNTIEENAVVAIANNNSDTVSVSITAGTGSEPVYYLDVEIAACTSTDFLSEQFWEDVISYSFTHLNEAEEIIVKHELTIYDEPIDVTHMRSSAVADLIGELTSLYGNEYSSKTIYSKTIEGQSYKVNEQMVFRVTKTGNDSIKEEVQVTAYIVKVLGLAASTKRIEAICRTLSIVISGVSKILPGATMDFYDCEKLVSRFVNVNGSQYPYHSSSSGTVHDGYDNVSKGNRDRAYMCEDIVSTGTSPDFYDLAGQVDEAYSVYKYIGQQP